MPESFETSIATFAAEEDLLGAILIQSSCGNREAIDQVSKTLNQFDFEGCWQKDNLYIWPRHARVFYAMLKCENAPNEVNVALKMNELDILRKEDCSQLAHFVVVTPCSLDYVEYANAVKAYSIQRQVKYHAEKGNYQKLNQLTRQTQKFTGGVEGL